MQVKKIMIMAVIIILATGVVAVASWQVASRVGGSSDAGASLDSSEAVLSAKEAAGEEQGEESGLEAISTGGNSGDNDGIPGGTDPVDGSDPGMVYVQETQRHQNFLKGLAGGEIKSMNVASTDFQPANNTSTLNVVFRTSDNRLWDGTITMSLSGGKWRIGDVGVSGGPLAGGTNEGASDAFKQGYENAINNNQDFLRATAEGRLSTLTVDSIQDVGGERVLNGKVVGKTGGTFNAQIKMKLDGSLWYITSIVGL